MKLLAAVLVSLACTGAAAQSNINPMWAKHDVCGPFKIAHINGVDTEQDEAEANLRRITQAYGNAHQEHLIYYVLAYNQTRGLPTDFYQASLQALSAFAGATWADYYNAIQSRIYTLGMSAATTAAIAKKVDDWYGITKPSPYSDQDLADILAALKYATQWSPGVRMVIVSHSQGNEYATLVVPKLIASGVPASSIGAVGVAVPDFSVPTGNTYVTSSKDFVTNATRFVLSILPANVTIPYNSLDPLGHNFIDVYMANSTARGKIVTGIKNEFASLKTPIKLGSANTGTSKFSGSASWADCTGMAPYGDMSKWPNVWPAGRDLNTCGSGADRTKFFVPMVFYRVAGQTSQIAAPGDPSEVLNLATMQRDTCIAQAMGYYKTLVATGTVAGTFGNCGSTYNVELAARYRDLISGDGQTSWTNIWTAASLGIGPYSEGGTDVYTGPTCKN